MTLREDAERRPVRASDTAAPAAFRAVQVLETLSQQSAPLTLTETAVSVGLPKSSTLNLLTTLEAAGMVRRSQRGWVIGYKALEIGQAAQANNMFAQFRSTVLRLPTLSTEVVLLAVLDGAEIVYLARHDGQQAVRASDRLASDVGRRKPAVVTSLGKAMLASLPEPQLDELLAGLGELPRPTRRAHRNVALLRADLDSTHERGYSVDFEQNTIGVTCIGVAIPGSDAPMAVSTTMMSHRFSDALVTTLVGELQHLALQLSGFAR